MMAACERTLAEGNSIMMFPEGTRSADGRLQRVQARRLHARAAHARARSCRSSSRAPPTRCRSAASSCRGVTRSASACSTRFRTRASPTTRSRALTERVRAIIAAELSPDQPIPPRPAAAALRACSRVPPQAREVVDFADARPPTVPLTGRESREARHAAKRDLRTARSVRCDGSLIAGGRVLRPLLRAAAVRRLSADAAAARPTSTSIGSSTAGCAPGRGRGRSS